MAKHIHLGVFPQNEGHHIAAWRHPDVVANAAMDFGHYRRIAETAERGLLDLIFFGDQMAAQYPEDETMGRTTRVLRAEPIVLLAALSAVTTHIGLVATVSTSYFEPFHVARKFAALDVFSGGRTGWNVVTSWNELEAKNFNRGSLLEHGLRYRRAAEFVEVTQKLWDSWEDDAFLCDKEKGVFFDPDKLHVVDHNGKYFTSRGPMNIERPPQGYPVIVQAGASEDGRNFAAKFSEIVFTATPSLKDAQNFYASIKSRAAAFGRDPEHIKIMPGVMPVVGATVEEAEEKFNRLQKLIDPAVGMMVLARHLGTTDLAKYDLDGPVPELPLTQGNQSRQRLLLDMARAENMTIRELYQKVVGTRGHFLLIGTPGAIADRMEEWVDSGAADGFNLMPLWLPGGLDEFVAHVIPELQRRGRFRTLYDSVMLRDRLGLPRPGNQFAGTEPGINQGNSKVFSEVVN